MPIKRFMIEKMLHMALNTPISVSWTWKSGIVDDQNVRIYNVNIFFEETFVIADAVIKQNQLNEKSIILFKKDFAEEFTFNEAGQYIRHIIAVKDSNGILYRGSFGAFLPVAEMPQQH